MPNLTQLGTNLFLGSVYSVVVHTDEQDQTWVAHHTDKTRQYRTDWTAQQVADAIEGKKTEQARLEERDKQVRSGERYRANADHNKLPWYKRVKKR
jgi:hypothetical protein